MLNAAVSSTAKEETALNRPSVSEKDGGINSQTFLKQSPSLKKFLHKIPICKIHKNTTE